LLLNREMNRISGSCLTTTKLLWKNYLKEHDPAVGAFLELMCSVSWDEVPERRIMQA